MRNAVSVTESRRGPVRRTDAMMSRQKVIANESDCLLICQGGSLHSVFHFGLLSVVAVCGVKTMLQLDFRGLNTGLFQICHTSVLEPR